LIIEGNGGTFSGDLVPWKEWEDSIDRIILRGRSILSNLSELPLGESIARMQPIIQSEWGNGFSWEYVWNSNQLIYHGTGSTQENGWAIYFNSQIDSICLADGLVWAPIPISGNTLILGKDVDLTNHFLDLYDYKKMEVSPNNPKYCSYNGALYSKDGSSLYYASQDALPFHPNLRYIESNSLRMKEGLLVLPWGLLTLNARALASLGNVTVVLPDTLTYVSKDCNYVQEDSHRYTVTVRFSEKNVQAKENLTGYAHSSGYGQLVSDSLPSVAEYYPNITPTGWQEMGGKTYYYSGGQKLTGWQVISPAWYYFDPDGSLVKNRWVKSGSSWYFLRNSNGMMSTNEWIDWYHVRYRTGPSGIMYANTWASINGKWYYFQSSGAMAANQWVRGKDGKWYYLKGDGVMATNQWIYGKDKKWYYVGRDGVMLTNTKTPDGYYVNANGVWVK